MPSLLKTKNVPQDFESLTYLAIFVYLAKYKCFKRVTFMYFLDFIFLMFRVQRLLLIRLGLKYLDFYQLKYKKEAINLISKKSSNIECNCIVLFV